jgi:hypothetical protein
MTKPKRTQEKRLAAKARKAVPKVTAARLAKSGMTTRLKGHVTVSMKRAQARRDARQRQARVTT